MHDIPAIGACTMVAGAMIPFSPAFRIIHRNASGYLPNGEKKNMCNKLISQMRTAIGKNGWGRRCSIFLGLLILGSGWMLAQEPATSLDQLKILLETGNKVTLVDLSGNSITGRVERIAPDALDLKVKDRVMTFTEKDIRQITQKKQDSVFNGILIGAAVGFGATLPINLGIADESEKGVAVAASALWGLIGGGIGAIVDASVTRKQLVYFRPRSKVSWSIHPFYSNSPSRFQKPEAGAFLPYSQRNMGVDPSKGLAVTVRF
jgi:hypothetical protein